MEKYKNRYWLKKKYLIDGFSSDEIGDMCGVNGRTIRYYLKRFGVKLERNIMMTKDIHVSLPDRLHENLKRHCSYRRKTTISSIIRMALIEFLLRNNFNPYKEKR